MYDSSSNLVTKQCNKLVAVVFFPAEKKVKHEQAADMPVFFFFVFFYHCARIRCKLAAVVVVQLGSGAVGVLCDLGPVASSSM